MPAPAASQSKWVRLGRAGGVFARLAALAAVLWAAGWYEISQTPPPIAAVDPAAHFASTGQDIWVAPGFSGPVNVYSASLQGVGGYWEAKPSLRLVLHGPAGSADIVGTSGKKQDWGESPYRSYATIVLTLDIAVPSAAAVGTEWHGELTGQIVSGSVFEGMTLPGTVNVNIPNVTLHVTTPDDVARRANAPVDSNLPWVFVQWGLSSLALLLGAVLAVRVYKGMPLLPIPSWVPRFGR